MASPTVPEPACTKPEFAGLGTIPRNTSPTNGLRPTMFPISTFATQVFSRIVLTKLQPCRSLPSLCATAITCSITSKRVYTSAHEDDKNFGASCAERDGKQKIQG